MINKVYCMSSYLALRYIEREDMDFYPGLRHQKMLPVDSLDKIYIHTANDIDEGIATQLKRYAGVKKGLLLSGGMDSAIVASYLEKGTDAYTFRFLGGNIYNNELKRAEYYAEQNKLNLHYVDINWKNTVEKYLDMVMREKSSPVHSIEPQIAKAAFQAKADGVKLMLIGDGSDCVFGGMNQLLGEDWDIEGFMERYIFVKPEDVLKDFESMRYVFERYNADGGKFDFLKFMDEVFTVESYNSYYNAFKTADMDYFDPYANMKMADPLDLSRIRNGESKYLIRELFAKKYPNIDVPEKIPMPRPVDEYFNEWQGPKRPEFKENLDMERFTGNQKWQLYCLERFLNLYEPD